MKLFLEMRFTYTILPKLFFLTISLSILSCSTQKPQYGKNVRKLIIEKEKDTSKVAHTFFLVGDAGNADEPNSQKVLSLLQAKLESASKSSTLIFLGDNIYPVGFSEEEDSLPKLKLQNQLKIAEDFKGKTIFIPGNHDWYSGIGGLERQADFVTTYLKDKKSFLPRKSCAIELLKVSDNVSLIAVDSEWFLTDWDKHPTINKDCDIKTREDFFEEFESLLKKNQDKTVIIAIHHPLITNGTHGGQFSLQKQLFPLEPKIPLPILGTVANILRSTSGASHQDLQSKIYRNYSNRIQTLLSKYDNVVVVSGHDHNLQFINKNNIKQIISGSGSKTEAAKAIGANDFSYGRNGYAVLEVLESGKTKVNYFGRENDTEILLFSQDILEPSEDFAVQSLSDKFPKEISSSIYSKKLTKKSVFYSFLFGKHYRKYYGTEVIAKTASLDTLFGGLTPIRAGGGHQSKSLRMADADGKEFVMRALKKSATQFLQTVAFKNQAVVDDFENTYAEDFLLDFYTTSHPFTPFAVGNLAEFVNVAHSNPQLFYLPKQKILGNYNSNYGDELYMIEERIAEVSNYNDENSAEVSDNISTTDLLKKLHKDEKYSVDEQSYIRARLFDMLIGDWDRHDDQWRWAEQKKGDSVVYKPLPRDRDQAFSKYDGFAIWFIMNIPDLRHMQTFGGKIRNVRWFNREPYPLDLALLKTATEDDWLAAAKYIQTHLSDDNIKKSFNNLPTEVQDETLTRIKANLKIRRDDLAKYAAEYYTILQETAIVVGTNKKDKFVIKRKENGVVEVQVIRIKSTGEQLLYKKDFFAGKTKHLWIYGLEDDDVFEVSGTAKSSIKIKLIGGQNYDSYTIEDGRKVKIFDFKSKENAVDVDSKTGINLVDDYDLNLYSYKKPHYNFFTGYPTIGYNPDDNVKVGFGLNYTVNNFKQNPYTQKHSLKGNYYFGTQGVELDYLGSFPELFGKWGMDITGMFTTPNFTMNYFGYGNSTQNQDEEFGMNYNRVRIQQLKVGVALKKIGRNGSEISFAPLFEQFEVEKTTNRFINIPEIINSEVFLNQFFASATAKYKFKNHDFDALPSIGLEFGLSGSWTTNLENSKMNFPTLQTNLAVFHKIDSEGNLVLGTNFKYKKIFNSNYFFYQGASIGGDSDLRGFRNDRFLGDSYFAQSTDIRITIGKIRESIAPFTYGILGGFDYGRVWIDGPDSEKWQHDLGGGIWINTVKMFTARLTIFKAPQETARVSFGLNFNF